MIPIPAVIMLMTIHFIADFLLQSDWMAVNKSSRWDVLAIHVTVYSACFFLFGFEFVGITWLLHFLTDAVTSRMTARLWFIALVERPETDIYPQGGHAVYLRGESDSYYGAYTHFAHFKGSRHWFFVVVGLDQLIHGITLVLTWRYA